MWNRRARKIQVDISVTKSEFQAAAQVICVSAFCILDLLPFFFFSRGSKRKFGSFEYFILFLFIFFASDQKFERNPETKSCKAGCSSKGERKTNRFFKTDWLSLISFAAYLAWVHSGSVHLDFAFLGPHSGSPPPETTWVMCTWVTDPDFPLFFRPLYARWPTGA